MEKFKLTYTDEMRKQDELWKQVIYGAKVKGWEGPGISRQGGTKVCNEDIIEEMRTDEVKVKKEINNKARRVRAWDKAYNSMDYQFFLSSYGQAYERPSSPGNTPYIEIEQAKGLILMEFVGKDDFDTDIFEDDVVSYFDTKEKKTKYAPVHYDKKAYGYMPMCKGNFENLRVVGNIYENKELEQLM